MKPILFSTPMVKAILEGRKTQTRRIVKHNAAGSMKPNSIIEGDILWVRETWLKADDGFYYKADIKVPSQSEDLRKAYGYKWRPSIFMPREVCRLFLKVKNVRVERLQDITEEDAMAEGVKDPYDYQESDYYEQQHKRGLEINKSAFAGLWDTIYAAPRTVKNEEDEILYYESYPWEDIQETREYKGKPWYVHGNPWVWAYGFEQVDKP